MMMRVNMNDVNSQRKNFKGGKENNKIWESVPVMIVFFSDCSSIDMMENNIFWNKIEKKVLRFYFVKLLILNIRRVPKFRFRTESTFLSLKLSYFLVTVVAVLYC